MTGGLEEPEHPPGDDPTAGCSSAQSHKVQTMVAMLVDVNNLKSSNFKNSDSEVHHMSVSDKLTVSLSEPE